MDKDSQVTEFETTSDDPFEGVFGESEEQAEENPVDSSPKEPQEESKPSQEGEESVEEEAADDNTPDDDNIPLHKHPRFKAKVEQVNQLQERLDKLEKSRQQAQTQPQDQSQNVEVPQRFQKLFGVDAPEVWQEFEALVGEIGEKKAEAKLESYVQEQRQEQQKRQQELQKATHQINQQFADLADETGLPLTNENATERNEIAAIAYENDMIKPDGSYNLKLAYDYWKLKKGNQQTKSDDKRKQIASNTTGSNKSSSSETKPLEVGKAQHMDWRQFYN